ncbi:MAG: hypothetical protein N2545_04205, partial [Thermoflexales bacterium]|nr:hypothetical protein [Thermoflexales bacterium]
MSVSAPSLPQTHHHGKPLSHRIGRLLLYAVMIALAAWFLLPVYLLLITAFKDFSEVSLSRMWDLPTRFSLES